MSNLSKFVRKSNALKKKVARKRERNLTAKQLRQQRENEQHEKFE